MQSDLVRSKLYNLHLKEINNKADIILHRAVDRIYLLTESGPKTNKMDRQVLSVGNEYVSFWRDRLGLGACSDREALCDS